MRTAQIDDAGDQAPFLPQIRDGYKYLGLEQLEQDSPANFQKKIEEKAQTGLRRILESALTTGQKIHLINTNIIPAVVYVTANIAPDEKRATTIKRCRDLDTKICSMLVDHKVKG